MILPDSVDDRTPVFFSHSKHETLVLPLSFVKRGTTITIHPGGVALKEVVVMPSPIRAKGDTISYNVDALRHASDRTIEDFISHLPGMSVDSQGNIYYNGMQINKFYIENNDMLGNRYSLATKNIRSEDVASVNVYERHQHIKALQDTERPESAALNITLKRKSMLRPVGTAAAGIGYDNPGTSWRGELFTMLIHKKTQSFLSAKATNFGQGYSKENLIRSGSISFASSPFENVIDIFAIKGIAGLPNEYFKHILSQNYSATSGFRLSEDKTLSCSINYSVEHSKWEGEKTTEYFTTEPVDNIFIIQDLNFAENKGNLEANINFELNKPNIYFEEKLYFSGIFSNNNAYLISDFSENVNQHFKQNNLRLTNNISTIIKRNGKMFQFNSKISFSNLPENFLNASVIEQPENEIRQSAKSSFLQTLHDTSLLWLVGFSSIGLNLELSTLHSWAKTFTQKGWDSSLSNINNQRGNKITLNLGPSWQFSNDKLNFNLSIPFSASFLGFSHLNKESFGDSRFSRFILLIGVRSNLGIKWTDQWRSSVSVSRNANEGALTDFIDAPIYSDYRSYSSLGSGIIGRNKSWMMTVNTSFRDVITGWFGNIKLMTRFMDSNRTKVSDVSSSTNSDSFLNINSNSKMGNISMNISKLIRQNTLGLELVGQLNTYNTLRNGKMMNSSVSGFTIKPNAFLSFFHHLLEAYPEVLYSFRQNKIKQASTEKNTSSEFRFSCPVSIFPHKRVGIKLKPLYLYNHSDFSNDAKTFLLDANITFKLKKCQIDFELSNITNRESFSSVRLNPFYIALTSLKLRGIEGLITFKYDF